MPAVSVSKTLSILTNQTSTLVIKIPTAVSIPVVVSVKILTLFQKAWAVPRSVPVQLVVSIKNVILNIGKVPPPQNTPAPPLNGSIVCRLLVVPKMNNVIKTFLPGPKKTAPISKAPPTKMKKVFYTTVIFVAIAVVSYFALIIYQQPSRISADKIDDKLFCYKTADCEVDYCGCKTQRKGTFDHPLRSCMMICPQVTCINNKCQFTK